MRRSTRIDGSAGGEPLSCGNQSTYNRVANAGNLHRLSPFQMPFGILHNLTGKSSLTFSVEKCHFITAITFSRKVLLIPATQDVTCEQERKSPVDPHHDPRTEKTGRKQWNGEYLRVRKSRDKPALFSPNPVKGRPIESSHA